MTNSMTYSNYKDEDKRDLIKKLHYDENKSINEIAVELGTYPNKIRRDCIRLGIPIKNRSESMKALYETGKKKSRKGEKLSDDVKFKISAGQVKSWKENYEERKEVSVNNIKDVVKDDVFERKRVRAIQKAAKEGSKLEKSIHKALSGMGYYVEFHKEHFLKREKLHIDLMLPKIRVAIEVDGPTHSKVVYSHEALIKNQRRDNKKTALLLTMGYVVIRVKHLKALSKFSTNKVISDIVDVINRVKAEFPPEGERLFILEAE